MKKLENQNLVVLAWRLYTKITVEEYVDAVDKLVYFAKKEVFDDIDKLIRLLEIDLRLMLKKRDKSACNKLSSIIEELETLKKLHLSPSTDGTPNNSLHDSDSKSSSKVCPCNCHKGGLLDTQVQSMCLERCCKNDKTNRNHTKKVQEIHKDR